MSKQKVSEPTSLRQQILDLNSNYAKLVIYPTDKFIKKVPAGFENEILKFASEIVEVEPGNLKRVLKIHGKFLKKRVGKYRIITWLKYIDNFPVLILLDMMARGDADYESFNYDAEKFEPSYQSLIEQEINEIKEILINLPHPPAKEILPDEFYPWLYYHPAFLHDADETLILESHQWYEEIQKHSFQSYLSRYFDILSNLFDNPQGLKIEKMKDYVYLAYLPNKPEFSVLFSQAKRISSGEIKLVDFVSEETTWKGGVIFLIKPVMGELIQRSTLEDEINHMEFSKVISNLDGDKLTLEELSRISYRAYPYYVLAEESTWRDIEQDLQTNLALSTEEEEILNSISSPENPNFPVFINGRAGSGKSTILYYLFADYCYKKITENLRGDPLFITYSPALSETALRTVEKILNSHAKFAGGRKISAEEISKFFKTFENLLIGTIPPEARDRFNPEKKVSLYMFKQMWRKEMHQNLPATLSPELAWFVIRAYIKGYDYGENEFMSTEDYSELPRKEKTIDEETFKVIYERIWSWYKKLCDENSFWDDQDLVRFALASLEAGNEVPEYPVIFCDEAQDFTRIELRFIMRLSVFYKYQINYGIKAIPFVFAGDPMQTINPTGFRWEKTKSIFHEEIITEIDPQNKFHINLHFKPLTQNYRSTPAITKFSNIILMWRNLFFDRELKPQIPWRTQEGSKPVRFIIGENIDNESLTKLLKEKIVIIPAEEGQISSFINSDEYLPRIFTNFTEEWPPKNIFTPMLAKGLEFDDVVVYKFGDHLDKMINRNNSDNKITLSNIFGNEDIPFEIEYFLNKLYVSITRAKKNLYIVDTKEGSEVLWIYTSEIGSVIPKDIDVSNWIKYTTPAQYGEQQTIFYTPEEKRKIANELKLKGMSQNEPSFLRRASQFFDEIGERAESVECLAFALKFEGNYLEASYKFESISKLDDQKECLILGKLWDELLKFYEKNPQYKNEPSYEVVKFICSPESSKDAVISFINFLKTYLNSGVNPEKLRMKPEWEKAISKLCNIITTSERDFLPQDSWLDCAGLLSTHFGPSKVILKAAALAYFYADDFENAVSIWERLKETNTTNYYIAKSKILNPPDNFKFLELLGEYDKIIEIWEENGCPVDNPWVEPVKSALNKRSDHGKLAFFYLKTNKIQQALDSFKNFVESTNDKDEIKKIAQKCLDVLRPEKNTDNKTYLITSLDIIEITFDKFESDKERNYKNCLTLFHDYFNFIPYSSLEFNKDKELSEKFEKILEKLEEANLKTLREVFNTQELCALFERTLSFTSTLKFYYEIVEESSGSKIWMTDIIKSNEITPEYRKAINKIKQTMSRDPDVGFILQRIAKVKYKQAEYHKDKDESESYSRHFEEFKKICEIFDLRDIESEPEYPEVLPVEIKFEQFKTTPELITMTKYEKLFYHLFFDVRVNVDKKLILITNDNYETLRISLEEKEDYPREFISHPFKIIVSMPEQNVISLEFQSKETGTWTPEGIAIIKFK